MRRSRSFASAFLRAAADGGLCLSHKGRGEELASGSFIIKPTQLAGVAGGGGGFGPAFGTEERRAAACADAALSPKVALAISPIPASEPSRLTASIGSMLTFWFGEAANCPNALM